MTEEIVTAPRRLSKEKTLTIWVKRGVEVDKVERFIDFLDNEGFRYSLLESNEDDDLDADFENSEWENELDNAFIKIKENGFDGNYDIDSFIRVYNKPIWPIRIDRKYILPISDNSLYNRAYNQLLDYVTTQNHKYYSLSTSDEWGRILSVKIWKRNR